MTLEIVKFAAERVRYREERSRRRSAASSAAEAAAAGAAAKAARDRRSKGVFGYLLRCLRSWCNSPDDPYTAAGDERGSVRQQLAGGIDREYLLLHSERILARFSNAFVNVARPMLAFAQPLEPTATKLPSPARAAGAAASEAAAAAAAASFTLWDTLLVPQCETADALTVQALDDYLVEQYGVVVQSLSLGDMLLFADFLPDSEDTAAEPLLSLIRRALEAGDDSDDDDRSAAVSAAAAAAADGVAVEGGDATEALLRRVSAGDDFILLDVTCVRAAASMDDDDDDDDAEADDDAEDEVNVQLPPLKVYLSPPQDAMCAENSRGGRSSSGAMLGRVIAACKRMLRAVL